MEISREDIINACNSLLQTGVVQKTAFEVAKGGLIAGGSAVVGGLLMGPMGFVVGSSIGGGLAFKASGDFKSLIEILLELSEEQQAELSGIVHKVCKAQNITSAAALLSAVKTPTGKDFQELLNNVAPYLEQIKSK